MCKEMCRRQYADYVKYAKHICRILKEICRICKEYAKYAIKYAKTKTLIPKYAGKYSEYERPLFVRRNCR